MVKGSLTLEDVVVKFSWEEWQLLDPVQKALYREVVLENYSHLVSVGYRARTPDALSRLDRGEPLWAVLGESQRGNVSEFPAVDGKPCGHCQGAGRPDRLDQSRQRHPAGKLSEPHRGHLAVRAGHSNPEVDEKKSARPRAAPGDTADSAGLHGDHEPCLRAGPPPLCAEPLSPETQPPSPSEPRPVKRQQSPGVDKPYVCSECGKALKKKCSLVIHRRTHTGEKPFVCGACGRGFSHKGNLLIHQRVHTGEKPYVCGDCGRGFSQKACLVAHRRFHTGKVPFSCSECGKCYTQKSALIRHRKLHSGERPFRCGECPKAFETRPKLVAHRRSHTGEKPYVCGDCGRGFSQKASLVRHQRVHTGWSPFACGICGKPYSQKSRLISHQKTHSGEKPFRCGECGKAFHTKPKLRLHRRSHTGEMPYGCRECGDTFAYPSSLYAHKRKHGGEKGGGPGPAAASHAVPPDSAVKQQGPVGGRTPQAPAVAAPAVAAPASVSIGGLLTQGSFVLVGQPLATGEPCGGGGMGAFQQDGRCLNAVNLLVPVNAVGVAVPSVSYLLLCTVQGPQGTFR